MKGVALVLAAVAVIAGSGVRAGVDEPAAPLRLETKIPLGAVSGRIDHFAVDPGRQRLFVTELGNNSVGVVDLKRRALLRTIGGLRQPQGVAYVASSDTLYVANAGDGSLHLFDGETLAPAGRIELGEDADNIRVDAQAHQVIVGYGTGALAVIDPQTRKNTRDILLGAHPEGFQLGAAGRIYVNLPNAAQIAVVDRAAGKQIAAWPVGTARGNFPMALEEAGSRVVVVFRQPARLVAFGANDGRIVAELETCEDADDVFVDAQRQRLYVSCGAGWVDVLQRRGAGYERVGRVPTARGARTSLFLPEADRLYVAVPASPGEPAAVWVLRPSP